MLSSGKGNVRKISANTPILRKLGMNLEDYFFDDLFLYQIRNGETINKVPLEKIISIKLTGTVIANRRVWLVVCHSEPDRTESAFRIVNNYTVFNRDFAAFLDRVRTANPSARVQKITFFRI
ncbi:hypothetical protein EHW64_20610 [Erwinia psidii]|uniref:Uncharacterized protein n=1 Tax=Erwinia psidii TaxID=69224 RepID=A0A3N6RVD8_9GAMM|nr:hypothetical protein [Erwinia psidii]MCX8963436.1 hypothetical protein [Erwinia psidii]RQM36327.1 hypothetical protein EB241_21140 [Erwinia psidii]